MIENTDVVTGTVTLKAKNDMMYHLLVKEIAHKVKRMQKKNKDLTVMMGFDGSEIKGGMISVVVVGPKHRVEKETKTGWGKKAYLKSIKNFVDVTTKIKPMETKA